MKSVLLFLAGVLVGANVVYFLVVRPGIPVPPDNVPTPTAQSATGATDATGMSGNDASRQPARPAAGSPVTTRPSTEQPATTHAQPPAGQPIASSSPVAPSRPVAPARPAAPDTAVAAPLGASPTPPAGLLLPVQGITVDQLGDTFNDTRGGGRRHEAQDIMAARGTPVLATRDGTIEKLFTSKLGGLTIYQFGPSRTHAYYYAHLDHYAAGLSEGSRVKRGQVIGYVGSTGNASPDAPHLHFAIFVLGPEKRWWEGTAIDPYPLLGGK